MPNFSFLRSAIAVALAFCAVPSKAATIFAYSDFSSTGLTLAGNASAGTALQLTPASSNQAGAAYEAVTLGAGDAFSSTFEFQFTGVNTTFGAANGIAFVLSAKPDGLAKYPGEDLGYYGVNDSLAIAFNTYNYGGHGSSSNYVSIDKNGALTNASASTIYGVSSCVLATYTNPGCMSNGDVWTVTLNYDGADLTVTLQDSAEPSSFVAISKYAVDLTSILGTTNNAVYVALTGGTGLAYQKQDILNWQLADTATTPEPGSIVLLAVGLLPLGCAAFARLRRRPR